MFFAQMSLCLLGVTMTYQTILYDVSNKVASITFNRPDVQNGFNILMCQEILGALQDAGADKEVRLIVFKAEGKVFSVGGDLVEMKRAVLENDQASLVAIAELVMQISLTMKKTPKPIVMVTDGAVAGAAFNMVLAADFCIASTNSRFIQAFVNVGLAPDAGGMYLLTRAVGMNRAMHLAMTGEAVTAEKALEYGFVYKVCEPDQLERMTGRLVNRLVKGPELSYAGMKDMMWHAFFTDFEEYAKKEVALQSALGFSEDFKEGVMAHAERRRPQFQGK